MARTIAPFVFCLLCVLPVSGHVTLLDPNGGETLRVGSVCTIRWEVAVSHNTVAWDLWYSTTGSQGPWIPIAIGLPPGNTATGAAHSYAWTVPNDVSGQVRVRVRQRNTGTNWDDVSAGNLAIVPSLVGSPATVSLATGGAVSLSLDAGVEYALAGYHVGGSLSGAAPGITAGSWTVPLNPDSYLTHTVDFPNLPPLGNTAGALDATGSAVATVTFPAGLPPSVAGVSVHHAFVVFDLAGAFRLVSNPVAVLLTP